MNFQDLKKIENADFYLDVAFRRANLRADELRSRTKGDDRLAKSKKLETAKLDVIKSVLDEHLSKILLSFPSIDRLDPFYNELIKLTLDYKDLKKSLGAINWAVEKVNDLTKAYNSKITRTNDLRIINKFRREYYGRVSSVLKQIKNNLNYLEEARKTMKGFPAIKTSMFTVCLFGFPNAGKSTLLSKLTTATPEIKAYAFTTKKLNLGYLKEPQISVQIIDTPGTLNRIDKMNYIEMQAYLALKYLANLVVYVFDPMLESSFAEQEKLLNKLEKTEKEIILYMSKTDIANKKTIDEFKKKYPEIKDLETLKKEIISNALKFKVL